MTPTVEPDPLPQCLCEIACPVLCSHDALPYSCVTMKTQHVRLHAGLIIPCLLAAFTAVTRADPSASTQPVVIRECLAIENPVRGRRSPVHIDAIESEIVAGTWKAPGEGDSVQMSQDDKRQWKKIAANDEGWFEDNALGGGYAYVRHDSEVDRVVMLEAMGHTMVYVNGEPRAGDPYSNGAMNIPILLRKGRNDLLFLVGRGRLHVELKSPPAELFVDSRDATLPDVGAVMGESAVAAVHVVNATTKAWSHVQVYAVSENRSEVSRGFMIPPLSARKVAINFSSEQLADKKLVLFATAMRTQEESTKVTLPLAEVELRSREPNQSHRRTFVSDIDGSAQYFAIQPQSPQPSGGERPALVLSLHGASVEATSQADAYAPKSWCHIVCPTNRRPFGFDWEDWGRMDAMEVLEIAQRTLNVDPTRVYLTGHSMGGHGTWSIGATYPDRFAAIGPSAGWESFASYGGGVKIEDQTGVRGILRRAAASSDTLGMDHNYATQGVYILHGDADDNVPVDQARTMFDTLKKFHPNIVKHEQFGAGHWWDDSDEPGASCVDWPQMFDFFARHRLPPDGEVRDVNFITVNPGVSARFRWATIESQMQAMRPSGIRLRWNPGSRKFEGETSNVRRLSLSVAHVEPGKPIAIDIDGCRIDGIAPPPKDRVLHLRQDDSPATSRPTTLPSQRVPAKWRVVDSVSPAMKGPHRSGPFKLAFNHRFMLVYGTRGSDEENAWALSKARFDVEMWRYRANGDVDVVPDTAFDAAREKDRGVVLYGNSETNAAWPVLLGGSPVRIDRKGVNIDDTRIDGDDLACLFLRPRPDSDMACVAVIGGTGIRGMRLTDRIPIFTSGVALPDVTVFGPECLRVGDKGIRVAGFFGEDWSLRSGEIAWGKPGD